MAISLVTSNGRNTDPDSATARLGSFLARRSLGAALLSNPATITWLTGYSAPIESGPSPFEGGPALVWVGDGLATLIVSDAERAAADAFDGPIEEYVGYTLDAPLAAFHPETSARDNLGTLAIVKALYRSGESGQSQAVERQP
jgi:hypothetical protein